MREGADGDSGYLCTAPEKEVPFHLSLFCKCLGPLLMWDRQLRATWYVDQEMSAPQTAGLGRHRAGGGVTYFSAYAQIEDQSQRAASFPCYLSTYLQEVLCGVILLPPVLLPML